MNSKINEYDQDLKGAFEKNHISSYNYFHESDVAHTQRAEFAEMYEEESFESMHREEKEEKEEEEVGENLFFSGSF